MLNKKLTSCSPVLLQDLEDDDDEEFEVRRSSSPHYFLHHSNNVIFDKTSSSSSTVNNTYTPTPTPITSEVTQQYSYGGITAPKQVATTSTSVNFAGGIGGGGGGTASVNNAITLAPSRNHHHHDPNVFAGGRPPQKKHNKRHKGGHHHHNHHHKSPQQQQDEGSILTRIDHSIMSNFGDWNTVEDEPPHPKLVIKKSRSNHRPYYLPSEQWPNTSDHNPNVLTSDHNVEGTSTSLPKLFKPYDVVVNNNLNFITNNSKVNSTPLPLQGTSKDNDDPHSILSEAKRTLNAYGVH